MLQPIILDVKVVCSPNYCQTEGTNNTTKRQIPPQERPQMNPKV
jgi:hypothetical protein